jgi:hypothetical protein
MSFMSNIGRFFKTNTYDIASEEVMNLSGGLRNLGLNSPHTAKAEASC